MKMENRSNGSDINEPRPTHKYTKYKKCLSMMMSLCTKKHLSTICTKQNLSSIWSLVHKKISNTEAELKKSVAYKKKDK